jgi:hypothetical protein
MRKILISAMLVSAVSVAAPAAAQFRGGGHGYGQGANIERQLDQIERQIDRLRDRRLISREEAFRLERRAEQIDRLHDRFARNGLSQYERRDLQSRIQNLRQRVQAERHEGRLADRRGRW